MVLNRSTVITVVMGGRNEEREVSLKSGKAVLEALEHEGFANAGYYLVNDESLPAFPATDLAFIAMHGRFGEDGVLQALLDRRGVAYTGSGMGASRLCMDKVRTKEMFRIAGVPTPKACVVERTTGLEEIEERVLARTGLPAVVKPVAQGSSVGITVVRDPIELLLGVTAAFAFTDTVMVEEYIEGRELTVGVLAGEALPIIEVRTTRGFYDFTAKYADGRTTYKTKPRLPRKGLTGEIREMVEKVFASCGCRHFARVDLRLSKKGEPFFLEVNTIPGMTGRSLFPMAAEAAGMTFGQLCVTICELALADAAKRDVA